MAKAWTLAVWPKTVFRSSSWCWSIVADLRSLSFTYYKKKEDFFGHESNTSSSGDLATQTQPWGLLLRGKQVGSPFQAAWCPVRRRGKRRCQDDHSVCKHHWHRRRCPTSTHGSDGGSRGRRLPCWLLACQGESRSCKTESQGGWSNSLPMQSWGDEQSTCQSLQRRQYEASTAPAHGCFVRRRLQLSQLFGS